MFRDPALVLPAACQRPASWWLPLTCLGLLAAAGACTGRSPASQPASSEAAVEVSTVRAVRQPVTRLLRATGTLMADEEAEVAAETAGRVVETPVERGTAVGEGAPLLRIVATEAEASVQEAEANVAQIEVRLALNGDQPFDVERVSEVSNARASMELAAAEFIRIKKLYDDHVVSGSEYDQRRTQVEVTQRQYDTARNNARQLYRSFEAANARLKLARKALADTVVRSPFAGLVVERTVSIGDFVTRGTKVVTVVRIHPLRVELTVPEQSLAAVRAGQPLELAVDAYPGRRFVGQVRYISPALRADQRALTIEAIVPNQDGLLKPGLFATAAIEQPNRENAVCVPAAAVRNLEGNMRVYVVKGDHVEERMVTVGQPVGDWLEIVNGLADGDQVAASNLDKLADGARIRATSAPVQPASKQVAPARSR
jgi:membrane fusion protein (multidrug efflux system)